MPVQDTSHAAYDHLRPNLSRREQAVWHALARYTTAPTAYELTAAMQNAGAAFDLNSVRPRLTALSDKHCVRRLGKRTCAITGRLAYTWQVVANHPPVRPQPKVTPALVVEARLF